MFFVYLLKSLKDKKLYIGYTANLRRRLKEHNLGLNRLTKGRKPLKLIYYEAYHARDDARQREVHLKLYGRTKNELLKRLTKSLAS